MDTKEKLIKVIECLASMVDSEVKADEALKYTQATLNVAHVIATLDNLKK